MSVQKPELSADTGRMDSDQDRLDHAVEEWADGDGEVTLTQWLMDRFGWDRERTERVVERYGVDPDTALNDGGEGGE